LRICHLWPGTPKKFANFDLRTTYIVACAPAAIARIPALADIPANPDIPAVADVPANPGVPADNGVTADPGFSSEVVTLGP
jgi:hypothetical protein